MAVLQVPDEAALQALMDRVLDTNARCPVAVFEEPDMDYQATASALGDEARKLLSSLPLAGND